MQLVSGLHFKNLRGDIYGGIVAAVVTLPLALAFGVSSGAGLYGQWHSLTQHQRRSSMLV